VSQSPGNRDQFERRYMLRLLHVDRNRRPTNHNLLQRGQEGNAMIHNFRHREFRERVTESILEMLTHLPESQRNIFVWSHYRGYPARRIAEILRCSPSEVEAALDAINSILYQKTHSLLEEDLAHGRDIVGKRVYRESAELERQNPEGAANQRRCQSFENLASCGRVSRAAHALFTCPSGALSPG
jgi:Sigma-70, region 4